MKIFIYFALHCQCKVNRKSFVRNIKKDECKMHSSPKKRRGESLHRSLVQALHRIKHLGSVWLDDNSKAGEIVHPAIFGRNVVLQIDIPIGDIRNQRQEHHIVRDEHSNRLSGFFQCRNKMLLDQFGTPFGQIVERIGISSLVRPSGEKRKGAPRLPLG